MLNIHVSQFAYQCAPPVHLSVSKLTPVSAREHTLHCRHCRLFGSRLFRHVSRVQSSPNTSIATSHTNFGRYYGLLMMKEMCGGKVAFVTACAQSHLGSCCYHLNAHLNAHSCLHSKTPTHSECLICRTPTLTRTHATAGCMQGVRSGCTYQRNGRVTAVRGSACGTITIRPEARGRWLAAQCDAPLCDQEV